MRPFLSIKFDKPFPFAQIASNLPKATALALTKTVQDSQTEVQKELPRLFTIRGPWWEKTNKFGIKIKAADKKAIPITAEIGTDADWLELHEGGGIKQRKNTAAFRKAAAANTNESFQRLVSGKNLIAIPTQNVRRTKRQIIQKSQKPSSLKKAFAVTTKRGNILILNRANKRSKPLPMYLLRKTAKISNESAVIEPTIKVVAKNINKNFNAALDKVLMPKTGKK